VVSLKKQDNAVAKQILQQCKNFENRLKFNQSYHHELACWCGFWDTV